MSRDRNRQTSQETGEEAPEALEASTPAPETEKAPEQPAPAQDSPVPENPDDEHVPLENIKGGCYVIGDNGRRVRVRVSD